MILKPFPLPHPWSVENLSMKMVLGAKKELALQHTTRWKILKNEHLQAYITATFCSSQSLPSDTQSAAPYLSTYRLIFHKESSQNEKKILHYTHGTAHLAEACTLGVSRPSLTTRGWGSKAVKEQPRWGSKDFSAVLWGRKTDVSRNVGQTSYVVHCINPCVTHSFKWSRKTSCSTPTVVAVF